MESLDILELIALLNNMIVAEKQNIEELTKLYEESDNNVVKFITGSLIHDSEKHILLQRVLIDILRGEIREVDEEDKKRVLEALEKHIKVEDQAMKALESIRAKMRMKGEVKLLKSLEQMLNLQVEEERRHHRWFKEVIGILLERKESSVWREVLHKLRM
ncbi:MAG: hypothetical protein DRJ33_01310 [Candidatus Methanomethylicota archaeon]|uniref:Rubrerythrin diiron-binding domain-containing protein n=1 Tax=Thermoproteota archaeon TaxID=2056631 RepID=A0A497F1I4_9CREN|nr:MAG: hypothetical protein DRJ33_01310 [Candidatus Verstraetearchaeota archaeon]